MQLIIHRGTREVGGTCIEVRSQRSRLVLDLGLPLFAAAREPLDSAALRRKSTGELQEEGILPNVPGLFDEQVPPTAILLSHAHLDHTGLLSHSRSEIPIYASKGTSKMMLAGKLFANQPELPRNRFRELIAGTPTTIGAFTITPFAVDHSIFGCLAFLIEADGKSVLYTGDLRLHGRKPGMQRALIEQLRDRVDVMLMEGTHFGFADGNPITEYELEDQIVKVVREAPSLVLASFSPQHVDRLVAFFRAAIKTGRTFVADEYTAFVMRQLSTEIPIPAPGSSLHHLRVFVPQTVEQSSGRRGLGSILEKFESSRITLAEIRQSPEKFLMVYRGMMLAPDFGNTFPTGTRCLYSRWEGYLDRPDWEPTKTALTNAGGTVIPLHTSGHMFATDIIRFIQAVNPKTIIPVHTFEPERFREQFDNVLLLNDGEPCDIR